MESGHDRRDFIKKGLVLAGAASLLTSALAPVAARAQTLGPMRRANRHDDSFIFERKQQNRGNWLRKNGFGHEANVHGSRIIGLGRGGVNLRVI